MWASSIAARVWGPPIAIAESARLADEATRTKLVEHLRGLGFKFVTLDLEGFRSGNLNRGLADLPGSNQL